MRGILLILYAGYVGSQILPSFTRNKPGTCPPSLPCICRDELTMCYGDYECAGSQKCCPHDCDCQKHCVEPVDRGCMYDGEWYLVGESFPSYDDCNWCFCDEDGDTPCTKLGCLTNGSDDV